MKHVEQLESFDVGYGKCRDNACEQRDMTERLHGSDWSPHQQGEPQLERGEVVAAQGRSTRPVTCALEPGRS